MKRLLLAASIIGLAPAAALGQGLVFTDNFTGGASPLWDNQRGGWLVSGGVYDAQSPSNNPTTYTGLPFSLMDFSLDVDIQQVADGGIWLRTDAPIQNGVLLVTGGNGWGAGNRGGSAGTSLYWHTVQGGGFSSSLNEIHNVFSNPGVQAAHIHVEVSGNVYKAFVDGTLTGTLTTSAFSAGRAALYDFSSQTFDNAQLTAANLLIQTTVAADKMTKIDGVNASITSAASGGTWTGTGLGSPAAQADPNHYGVGVFDNAILQLASFGGQSTNSGSVLIAAAHLGDANDNGVVDIQDQSIITNNWQQPSNNWAAGDLNRDGFVDIQDLTIVTNNWQQASTLTLVVGSEARAGGTANLPEPASVMLLAGGAAWLLAARGEAVLKGNHLAVVVAGWDAAAGSNL